MAHLRRDQTAAALGEHAVALDQEVLEAPGLDRRRRPDRRVRCGEAGVGPRAQVVHAAAVRNREHSREPVAKAVERLAHRGEERARRVEAQEPDARFAADPHVRPHVELGDRGERQAARRAVGPRTDHDERDDGEPALPVAQVGFDVARKHSLERAGLGGPMCEEQVLPSLGDEPARSSSIVVGPYHTHTVFLIERLIKPSG
jgi:hypothetical protein